MADCGLPEKPQTSKIRHDWYQTETHIIINILYKNVKESDLRVDFRTDSLSVSFPIDSSEKYNLNVTLPYEVNPSGCSYRALPSKVEVKLKKKEGFRWEKLECDTSARLVMKNAPHGESASQPVSKATIDATSSKPGKNWDKVVSDITNSEEYKPVEEDAINALFQKIYSEGSDEVRKAMNKSFVESKGTVLSTNWDEVKTDKVDCKLPDGVEWKKWDA